MMAAPIVAEVAVEHGEDIDFVLKRFKKALLKSGVFGELKRGSFYMKPSERRRFKRQQAANKRKKAERRRAGMVEVKPFTNTNGNGSRT